MPLAGLLLLADSRLPAALSQDEDVLAASVVRFTVDELGTRASIAMFVDGERQVVPFPYLPSRRA